MIPIRMKLQKNKGRTMKQLIILITLCYSSFNLATVSQGQAHYQLLASAEAGSREGITAALEAGADINAKVKFGRYYPIVTTALHLAAGKGHEDCVRFLLESGADFEARDKLDRTAFKKAKSLGKTACASILWRWPQQIIQAEERTILQKEQTRREREENRGDHRIIANLTSDEDFEEMLTFIKVEAKTTDSIPGDAEATRIQALARSRGVRKNLSATKIQALGRGRVLAKKKIKNHARISLMGLIKRGDLEGTKRALKRASLEVNEFIGTDNRSRYSAPIHIAAEEGQLEILRFLIENGADVNSQDKYEKSTPLILAAREGHLACLELLIASGANLHVRERRSNYGDSGRNAFHWAAIRGHQDCLAFLLAQDKSLLNKRAKSGRTALHYAAEMGRLDCVRFLIAYRADLSVLTEEININNIGEEFSNRYKSKQTALSLAAIEAETEEHLEIVKLLYSAGIKVDIGFPLYHLLNKVLKGSDCSPHLYDQSYSSYLAHKKYLKEV